MAHFAKIENGIVVNVIVADHEFINTLPGEWVQTSYNTRNGQHPEGRPLRWNYAQIGGQYDPVRDVFLPKKLFDSWLLDEDTLTWKPPIPLPSDASESKRYQWDEEIKNWVETTTLEQG